MLYSTVYTVLEGVQMRQLINDDLTIGYDPEHYAQWEMHVMF